MIKIMYLCDGEVPSCKKMHCYKKTDDTPCRHTSDINHALNFRKPHVAEGYYYEQENGCAIIHSRNANNSESPVERPI